MRISVRIQVGSSRPASQLPLVVVKQPRYRGGANISRRAANVKQLHSFTAAHLKICLTCRPGPKFRSSCERVAAESEKHRSTRKEKTQVPIPRAPVGGCACDRGVWDGFSFAGT